MSQKEEQIGFDFGEKDLSIADNETIEKAFQGFHSKHPHVWRFFRQTTLEAVDADLAPIRPHTIMAIVRRKTLIPVDFRLIPLYANLFTSNHQELAWVFKK